MTLALPNLCNVLFPLELAVMNARRAIAIGLTVGAAGALPGGRHVEKVSLARRNFRCRAAGEA